MSEKESIVHCEEASIHREGMSEAEDGSRFNGSEELEIEKKVIRKIDIRLVPILGLLYTASLVDRSNISVARISGLDEDVDLDKGNRASIALLVFFIGYIIFEIPSNMVIQSAGVANWIAGITFAWGLVTLGIGFLSNWVGLAICRAVLGIFEAGFYPGCVYLIASWYKRYEVQKRLAFFYLTSTALTAFANIFAYGLIQIANKTTYKGWRWIYIIEGSLTSFFAVIAWFVIVDFPASKRNKFLSPEEKQFALDRLAKDRGTEERQKVSSQRILDTLKDWKVWSFSLMYMSAGIGVYAFLFFLPIILMRGLSYSLELAFLLSAPPSIFAVIEAFIVAWLADKLQSRGLFVIFQACLAITGLCVMAFVKSPTPRYIGTFLGMAGVNGMIPTVIAWQQNNIVGDAKRAVATAVLVMTSAVGGIYSSLVFRQQDAPDYIPGIIAVIAPNAFTVVLAIVTILTLRWQNKLAENGKRFPGVPEGFKYTY
ncbi:uncharacterized protein Z519_10285 [Cladophialophora bantiana CBS 173.52]|uniref:Major facilitator superfamily (MFS) profile domain-containing protein n=1 Tax=Cladophialophora bantiana (strain ATCC 10958 / CBS 173.52 / CDC B-1940 / NIH 8579) TaxID=1442370 RepID=A0A0D2EFE3_CLAB1|nr:uncharacterized protein Z519_10285 [Cladophialophora bantiana CBS 173.52]KIW88801.1 hypothetical protein Z519_10285 [Cladophialophora bantiana CBS 173.52]